MSGAAAVIRHLRRRFGPAAADADLLRAYAAGHDADAFRALVERHGSLVLAVCRRLGDAHAAEDAFQATFLALARHAGTVRQPEALAAWLNRAAERVCGRARAAAVRRRAAEGHISPRSPADPAADLTARELLAALDAELDRLPERYRLPVWLAYWQGLPHAEAARRLGLSAGAFHGRLERGRRRLADRLRRRGFAPGDLRPLLLAAGGATAVSSDLLARTVGLAAAPWSSAIPAAVAALVAAPSKLLPACVLSTLLAGGMIVLAAGTGTQPDAPKPAPPAVATGPAVDRFGDPLPPGAVARLGTLRFRADDVIAHPIVLPDNRQVIFVAGAAVVVMDLDTGKIIRRITRVIKGRVSTNPVTVLALAPDGRTLAVGCRDFGADGTSTITFWLGDAATGAVLREFNGRDRPVQALAFLSAGRNVAALDDQGIVTIWDTGSGAKIREIHQPGGKFASLASSVDGKIVAAGGEAKNGAAAVCLWDTASGKLLHTLAGHTADVKAVAFAPDGRTLASGGNAAVRLWDVATGRELRQLNVQAAKIAGGEDSIHSLAFSPDGRTIASAGTDWTVRVWAVATGQGLDEMPAPTRGEHALTFRSDQTLLIGGGYTLLRRDILTRRFAPHDGPPWWMVLLSFSPDGRAVVTADSDSTVRTWDAASGRLLSVKVWSPLSHRTFVSPGGKWVAFTEDDADRITICIGDVASGQVIRRLADNDQYPMAVSADGRRLATLRAIRTEGADDPLTVWDVATGTKVGRLNVGDLFSIKLALTPDGRTAFTTDMNQRSRLRQWDVATGRAVREYSLPKDAGAHGLAVSAGGRRLAVLWSDGTVRFLDVATGRECWRSETMLGRRNLSDGDTMVFSPDGSWLATTDLLEKGLALIDIWDARTGKHVTALRGHDGGVVRMAFSPDSRRLASTSQDGTALIWDVEAATGRRVVSILDPARQAELWADLAGDDALGAHAIDCLQAAPVAAVTILKQKLRSAVGVPADRIAPFVAGLDSPTFAVREKAQRDLAALGTGAEPAVRTVRDAANAEVRRRIDAVLAGWEGEQRRAGRAVEVLEYVATPDARKLLEELAGGDPNARLTQQAKASLARLDRPRN